ncbi:hypothetical protein EAF04_008403 [Stromatinia cepivora]|nr:hypothetical protein EAF04_008403 [Stromatinia cepivora]
MSAKFSRLGKSPPLSGILLSRPIATLFVGRFASFSNCSSFSASVKYLSNDTPPTSAQSLTVKTFHKIPLNMEQHHTWQQLPFDQDSFHPSMPKFAKDVGEKIFGGLDKSSIGGKDILTNASEHFRTEYNDNLQMSKSLLGLQVWKKSVDRYFMIISEKELSNILVNYRKLMDPKMLDNTLVDEDEVQYYKDMTYSRHHGVHDLQFFACLELIIQEKPEWAKLFEALFGISPAEAKQLHGMDDFLKLNSQFRIEDILSHKANLEKWCTYNKFEGPFQSWLSALRHHKQSMAGSPSHQQLLGSEKIQVLVDECIEAAKADGRSEGLEIGEPSPLKEKLEDQKARWSSRGLWDDVWSLALPLLKGDYQYRKVLKERREKLKKERKEISRKGKLENKTDRGPN